VTLMIIRRNLRSTGSRVNDLVVQRLVCLSLVFTVALYFTESLVLYVMSSYTLIGLNFIVQSIFTLVTCVDVHILIASARLSARRTRDVGMEC
jgi:hypothetical protein